MSGSLSAFFASFVSGAATSFSFVVSTNQTNANLATLATAAGWNGVLPLTMIIDNGVYISSNSTGTPALTVNGSFPGGVSLINNGYIVGMGGNGGAGGNASSPGSYPTGSGSAGTAGGLALSVSVTVSINNGSGTIAGGGGGGGGGRGGGRG